MATAVTEVETHLPAPPSDHRAGPLLRHVGIALSFLLLMTAGQYVVTNELADIFDPDAYGLVQIVFQIGMLVPMLFGLQLADKGHEVVAAATAFQRLWRFDGGRSIWCCWTTDSTARSAGPGAPSSSPSVDPSVRLASGSP